MPAPRARHPEDGRRTRYPRRAARINESAKNSISCSENSPVLPLADLQKVPLPVRLMNVPTEETVGEAFEIRKFKSRRFIGSAEIVRARKLGFVAEGEGKLYVKNRKRK